MISITRLFDFPYYQLENFNISDALVTKQDGKWIKTSTEEYIAKANAISRALVEMGVQKNKGIQIAKKGIFPKQRCRKTGCEFLQVLERPLKFPYQEICQKISPHFSKLSLCAER